MNPMMIMNSFKCNRCFEERPQYVYDCFCLFCELCARLHEDKLKEIKTVMAPGTLQCVCCKKKTKGTRMDIKVPEQFQQIQNFFHSCDVIYQKTGQILKFQHNQSNLYQNYCEKRIQALETALREIMAIYPDLRSRYSYLIHDKPPQPIPSQAPMPNVGNHRETNPNKQETIGRPQIISGPGASEREGAAISKRRSSDEEDKIQRPKSHPNLGVAHPVDYQLGGQPLRTPTNYRPPNPPTVSGQQQQQQYLDNRGYQPKPQQRNPQQHQQSIIEQYQAFQNERANQKSARNSQGPGSMSQRRGGVVDYQDDGIVMVGGGFEFSRVGKSDQLYSRYSYNKKPPVNPLSANTAAAPTKFMPGMNSGNGGKVNMSEFSGPSKMNNNQNFPPGADRSSARRKHEEFLAQDPTMYNNNRNSGLYNDLPRKWVNR